MSQTQLEEFLNGAVGKPYRELVQHHIRKTATVKLQQAVFGEAELLPQHLQRFIVHYIDATNSRFGNDREFWA